jgi:hypothetical protein
MPQPDLVYMLWTERIGPGCFTVNVGRYGHDGPPTLGRAEHDYPFYAASFGDSVQSPYCLQRDGFVRYNSRKADYARNRLRYRLPWLDELRRYRVYATFYHESPKRLSQRIEFGDTAGMVVDIDSGKPVTVWFDLPPRRYRDGTAYFTLRRLGGDRVVLSDLKVYQYGGEEEQQGGGTQTAAIAPPFKALIRSAVPNPFTGRTGICYEIGVSGPVSLRVFDISGRVVRVLESRAGGSKEAGVHIVSWNGRDDRGRIVPGAVYFCRLEAQERKSTMKVIRTR